MFKLLIFFLFLLLTYAKKRFIGELFLDIVKKDFGQTKLFSK